MRTVPWGAEGRARKRDVDDFSPRFRGQGMPSPAEKALAVARSGPRGGVPTVSGGGPTLASPERRREGSCTRVRLKLQAGDDRAHQAGARGDAHRADEGDGHDGLRVALELAHVCACAAGRGSAG